MDDIVIARKYINKASNAAERGHEFDLSFIQFKRILTKVKCHYSGVPLTDDNNRWTSRTLDRIDNSKGYILGNVVVCCHGINQLKSISENPQIPINYNGLIKALNKMKKETT